MKEYRIVKETTTNTNEVMYYIESKKKFLIWEWWYRLNYIRFARYAAAKRHLDKLTDQIITEVIK